MKKYLFAISIILSGCSEVSKYYPDDNLIENYAEDIIEEKSGIKIDFSGRSEESKERWTKK